MSKPIPATQVWVWVGPKVPMGYLWCSLSIEMSTTMETPIFSDDSNAQNNHCMCTNNNATPKTIIICAKIMIAMLKAIIECTKPMMQCPFWALLLLFCTYNDCFGITSLVLHLQSLFWALLSLFLPVIYTPLSGECWGRENNKLRSNPQWAGLNTYGAAVLCLIGATRSLHNIHKGEMIPINLGATNNTWGEM